MNKLKRGSGRKASSQIKKKMHGAVRKLIRRRKAKR